MSENVKDAQPGPTSAPPESPSAAPAEMNTPVTEVNPPLAATAVPAGEMNVPPVIPPPAPPVAAPPILESVPAAATPPPVAPERVSVLMRLALIASAVLLVWLSFIVSGQGRGALSVSYRIGSVIGAVLLWPAIILALFSIGRRFRTPRRRAIILLSVWGVCIMGQLGNVNLQQRRASLAAEKIAETLPAAPRRAMPEAALLPGPSGATPAAPATSDAPLRFDFSRGSDERLIQLIETAQQERYRAIADEYVRACAARPNDAALAIERVRFCEKFAQAEDLRFEGADADLEAARTYLTSRFRDAPATVLYQMQRAFGPEFDALVKASANKVTRWPKQDRAKFFLERAEHEDNATQKELFARLSFEADPGIEAGLLMLEGHRNANRRNESRELLDHPVFTSGGVPWMRKQIMDFLFEAGRNARAFALYRELKEEAPRFVQNSDTALKLAAAGHLDAARAIFDSMPLNHWNRERVQRERFSFELQFGNAEQATAAYGELRSLGLTADPLLRDRVELFLAHPTSGWGAQDIPGLLLLGFTLLALLLLPAVLLVPVHYWSLLRARRGKPTSWPGARWGLREAWIVIAVYCGFELAAVWTFRPAEMRTWWSDAQMPIADEAVADSGLLAQQGLVWLGLTLALLMALWRGRGWHVLGRGNWTWGRTIGACLGGTVFLRILLLGYTAIWPEAVSSELASFSPQTKQLCAELAQQFGPAGLIVAIAVLVPVLEELLFRGVLLQALAKHIPFGWANATQAALFAAIHENVRIFPFFFAFGIVCGILARRSGGLAAAMALHACNNLLACVVLIYLNRAV